MNKSVIAFGRLLRNKREAMKLSQTAFAHKAGWPQTTVSRVEQGGRCVTLPELLSAARVFGCSVSELLCEMEGAMYGSARERELSERPGFTPGFGAAYADKDIMLAQLARYGIRFMGEEPAPAVMALPLEETILAALRFAGEARIFETLPALALKYSGELDWNKLIAGAYALRLQNRLGMTVAAALQLKACTKDPDDNAWVVLRDACNTLAAVRLDREEVIGPRPVTEEALTFLRGRTPEWLRFWHGLGTADLESFKRYLHL